MGLFGKKEKIPDGIRVQYYDGELKEFPCNYPCQLLLMDDVLRITKINPYTEVKLDRKRILSLEVLEKNDYMQKYKGVSGNVSKRDGISTSYYVINYLDKNGENKHIDFWGTSSEYFKICKMRDELIKNQKSTSYEI